MASTVVHRSKRFEKDLDSLPDPIRTKAIVWVNFVETLGLLELRKRAGYHDEPLKGERKGQRSVRLNKAYRLIYTEVDEHHEIFLKEITKHEY